MKKWILVLAMFALLGSMAEAAVKKYADLVKDEAFAKATVEQKLEYLQQKLESKEFASGDINADLIFRLMLERLKDEKDPVARITTYGVLRQKCPRLPQTYELDAHLISDYLVTTTEGQKGDLVGMMKLVQQLLTDKKTSWPAVAPIHEGMLHAHLTGNAEYQAMSPKDKLGYLKKLVAEKACSDMTTTRFARGVLGVVMTATAEDQRKAVLDEHAPNLDFFTKSSITNSFECK
jgi:hypothetical protein